MLMHKLPATLLCAAALTALGSFGLGSQYALAAGAAHAAVRAGGPSWAQLTPSQREALKPLEQDWNSIEPDRKQKWLEISSRFPRMGAAERERVQARMADWARLTPSQRGQARLNYQEAKVQASREERQARWEQYKALPEDKRQELAARADARRRAQEAAPPRAAAHSNDVASGPAGQLKSNVVPNPLHSAQHPKRVAPTVVQVKPGATTILMSKRPVPPVHQQTGLPKIAATPEFVDSATLLPQRGPQGAAVEPVRKPTRSSSNN
ncbi:MAG TPA: DUF3106 domain-containing protein [Methylibium sp.]